MAQEPEQRGIKSTQITVVHAGTVESQRWAEPVVARLATEFWRLKRRLERAEDGGELTPLRDSITRIDDVFAEHQVRAVDHDGELYDPGLQVEVLHQREGSGAIYVQETVKPTITLEGRVLQHGQVVIGPDETSTGEERE